MKLATISSKGQITIPKAMQQHLQVTPGSRVILSPEKGTVLIKPLRQSIVEQTSGSLRKYIPKEKLGKPWNEIIEETQRLAAKEIAEKKRV